eukprot:TRINITY_DN40_c0_g1_i1.p1 TRINITY_DN40_c0_g1~~TRINITY_DN40_c0_g1_i1.p1  ORF type:complete len:266 (-),score=77.95 TRINITY_DN40_c0_g1_i1:45-842(-)
MVLDLGKGDFETKKGLMSVANFRRVRVYDLPSNYNREAFNRLVSKYGRVKSVEGPFRNSNEGFVTYLTSDDAEYAVVAILQKYKFHEHDIRAGPAPLSAEDIQAKAEKQPGTRRDGPRSRKERGHRGHLIRGGNKSLKHLAPKNFPTGSPELRKYQEEQAELEAAEKSQPIQQTRRVRNPTNTTEDVTDSIPSFQRETSQNKGKKQNTNKNTNKNAGPSKKGKRRNRLFTDEGPMYTITIAKNNSVVNELVMDQSQYDAIIAPLL